METKENLLERMRAKPETVAAEYLGNLKELNAFRDELSKCMPFDFKDWWENSKSEWPLVARLVIEETRRNEKMAWEMLEKSQDAREKMLEKILKIK